jgi:purine-binding chemotaxis protein CheW
MTAGAADRGARLDEDVLKLVGFRIEDWRFAVRLEQVKTSIMPCRVTRVFCLPDYVQGIISLRGSIVGVLDLGRLLGIPSSSGGHRRLIVVESQGLGIQAAIPVHDVFRVPDVPRDAVAPLPPSVSTAQKPYLEGIVNLSGITEQTGEGDTITLVDADTLFDAPALRELRGAS